MTFPIDWDEWSKEWRKWVAGTDALGKSVRRPDAFKGKNFLADDVLGYFTINGVAVELSEVTFPDFTQPAWRADHVRYVGITYINAEGEMESGDLVDSFDALEEALKALSGVEV